MLKGKSHYTIKSKWKNIGWCNNKNVQYYWHHNYKCDQIKQNEWELANIDFKIQSIITSNFLCIFVLSSTKMLISLEPEVQF